MVAAILEAAPEILEQTIGCGGGITTWSVKVLLRETVDPLNRRVSDFAATAKDERKRFESVRVFRNRLAIKHALPVGQRILQPTHEAMDHKGFDVGEMTDDPERVTPAGLWNDEGMGDHILNSRKDDRLTSS